MKKTKKPHWNPRPDEGGHRFKDGDCVFGCGASNRENDTWVPPTAPHGMCPSNPRAEGKFTFTWRHTKPFTPPDGGHSWMISESGGYVHCVHCRTSVVLTHGLLTKPLPSGLCDLSPVMKVRRKFGQILSWV